MSADAPVINLVVNCTARKTVKGGLAARFVRHSDLGKRVSEWTKTLGRIHAPQLKAKELYCGDSWSTIRSAVSALPSGYADNWWIVSAGHGLVQSDELVVPYSATFTRGQADSVLMPCENAAGGKIWWGGLCRWRKRRQRRPASLCELAEMEPTCPLLVALSAEYIRALEDDLLAAKDALSDPDLLIVVSVGGKKTGELAPNFLPCDARLENLLGGVRASLNARIVRRILEKVRPKKVRISYLREVFEGLLQNQQPLRVFARQKLSDQKIRQYIAKALRKSKASSHSAMLRDFREGGQACEQKRFRRLFLEIKDTNFARK